MEFTFPRDPNEYGQYLRKKETFTIESGLTILVGCNGSGKTTLIRDIHNYCKDNKIPVVHFDNLTADNNNKRFMMRNIEDISYVATMKTSSEGERNRLRIGDAASKMGYYILNKYRDSEDIFILIDALGSGLSIDNIQLIKKELFNTILESNTESQHIYIIVSANEYEFCENENCFDVQECKYRRTFKSYNAYRNFILRSKEKRDKIEDRYNKIKLSK